MTYPQRRSGTSRGTIAGQQLIHFNADSGGGGGGGGQQQPQTDPAQFQAQLQRYQGDVQRFAEAMYRDLTEAQRQLTALRGQVPAAGSTVLTAEQATAWAAYQQLGAPDALQQRITEAQRTQRDLQVRRAADAAGFKPAVLGQLAGDLAMEFRQVDGKDTVFVKDGDKEVTLSDYAKVRWTEFLPALQPAQQAAGAQGQTAAAPGTFFPAQQPAAQGTQGGDLVTQAAQRFQQQRDAAPSPFKPLAPPQQGNQQK